MDRLTDTTEKENENLEPLNLPPSQKDCSHESSEVSSMNSDTTSSTNNRESWGNKLDFFLSCVGYAVGLGNLWRFPYLCMRNGGGAFLIPYFIFLFLCGMPIFFLELALGQFASLSPMAVWKNICPIFSGLGYGMVLVSGLCSVYYNIILAWALYYIIQSFTTGVLPWASCSNSWNTVHCIERLGNNTLYVANATVIHNISAGVNATSVVDKMTAAEEFWHYRVLQLSEGVEHLGGMRWELAGCLLFSWIVVFLCMFKGIQTSGKVVYVTAIAPYIMLLIFLVRGVTLPGAELGILYYLTPDFNKLKNLQVWVEACAQIFYSLGPAYGSLITMSSYSKFNNNCVRDAMIIPIINCGTSFLAGFAIFSIIGFMSHESGIPVKEVITSGPGLAFVAYPEALTKLPVSPFWAIIFFLMLFILGLDTQFGMFECLVSGFIDVFPKVLRPKKTTFTAMLSSGMLLLGLPIVTKAGIYIFQIFDWYCATFALITIAMLECIIMGWIYGANRVYHDIEMMIGSKPFIWWKICWKFITPLLLMAVLSTTILQFSAPTYGDYIYPLWAITFGWLLAMSSLVPIPLMAVYRLITCEGTLLERLRFLTSPSEHWGPADIKNRAGSKYYHTSTILSPGKEQNPSVLEEQPFV